MRFERLGNNCRSLPYTPEALARPVLSYGAGAESADGMSAALLCRRVHARAVHVDLTADGRADRAAGAAENKGAAPGRKLTRARHRTVAVQGHHAWTKPHRLDPA